MSSQECAGYRVREWCRLTSLSRSKYYDLPTELQPFSVVFGRRRIIRESPSAWLDRVATANKKAA